MILNRDLLRANLDRLVYDILKHVMHSCVCVCIVICGNINRFTTKTYHGYIYSQQSSFCAVQFYFPSNLFIVYRGTDLYAYYLFSSTTARMAGIYSYYKSRYIESIPCAFSEWHKSRGVRPEEWKTVLSRDMYIY